VQRFRRRAHLIATHAKGSIYAHYTILSRKNGVDEEESC
jgi:hypothetical protein